MGYAPLNKGHIPYSKKIIIKYSTTNTTEQIFKRYNNKYEKGRSSKMVFL